MHLDYLVLVLSGKNLHIFLISLSSAYFRTHNCFSWKLNTNVCSVYLKGYQPISIPLLSYIREHEESSGSLHPSTVEQAV